MKTVLLIVGSCALSTATWANQQWRCQNMVAKEVCNQSSCVERKTSQDAFDISLSSKQAVSICNKNNCWRGQAKKMKVNEREVMQVEHFTWKTEDRTAGQFKLMISPSQGSLYLQSDSQNYQLQCRNV